MFIEKKLHFFFRLKHKNFIALLFYFQKVYFCYSIANILAQENWFETWFDSPFYHLLYKNRDFKEAEAFIRLLVTHLELKQGQKVLDLACGKGRHAFYLNQLGLDVTGLDLASNSISEARKMETENLHFDVHDMRKVYPNAQFDCIFNLFTSFGYFDDESDNLKVLQSAHTMLNDHGLLVIDFMNAHLVQKMLVAEEEKVIEEVRFHIQKRSDGKHIYKKISFDCDGNAYNFEERVQALGHSTFTSLLKEASFDLLETFGSYQLDAFDLEKSPRLILIARKR